MIVDGTRAAQAARSRVFLGRGARLRRFAVLVTALSLAACGGEDGEDEATDGGSSSPTTPTSSTGNHAPTISGSPTTEVMINTAYEFAPNATDADNDVLHYTIVNKPAWATFDSATGRLSGTPSDADAGTYSDISIGVSDGELSSSLQSFSISVVTTASGSATLSWTAPTEKTDGGPVNVAGYKIYYGTASRRYSNSIEVTTPGLSTYVVENLTPATWYFAVTAIDDQGIESAYSNEASKQVL